jgi:hypothetical protein
MCCQNRAITCNQFAIMVMHVQTGSHREVMVSDYDSDDNDDNEDLVCIQNCQQRRDIASIVQLDTRCCEQLPLHTHRQAK